MSERDAQLKEAARELLQLSKALDPCLMDGFRYQPVAKALSALLPIREPESFYALIKEVAAEEGIN